MASICKIKWLLRFWRKAAAVLNIPVCFGRHPASVADNTLIFFPYQPGLVCCGIAGIVIFKKAKPDAPLDIEALNSTRKQMTSRGYEACVGRGHDFENEYLGGRTKMTALLAGVRRLKESGPFVAIYQSEDLQNQITRLADGLAHLAALEDRLLKKNMSRLTANQVDHMAATLDDLKDSVWCLKNELLANIRKIRRLTHETGQPMRPETIVLYKSINAVLNGIDRLEVRGRDSAGFSMLFVLTAATFKDFEKTLQTDGLFTGFQKRQTQVVLTNNGIRLNVLNQNGKDKQVALALTYKVAAEIGRLGDNVRFLRHQIQTDPVLKNLTTFPYESLSFAAHTRWASMGAITEANCHPVDNFVSDQPAGKSGIILAALNGDIDNYLDLKKRYEADGALIPAEITTDTKIITLQIEHYVRQGHDTLESFRRAVNDFEGSHAIIMQTDLAPGKLFLAQRGSGQAIFIGIAKNHYIPASEVYGIIEETPHYIKLDGEKIIAGKEGPTQGQVVVLDQNAAGGLSGIEAIYYDGTPFRFSETDVKETAITSRDIDRQDYPHYFLKEISEAPQSVAQTLLNRWKVITDEGPKRYVVSLDESVVPPKLKEAFLPQSDPKRAIRRILWVGQGTAGVAALACANIVDYYLNDPKILVSALKSSELSGFKLDENDGKNGMADTLVVAISQSGTTTDTNRTVDMVKERGAYTLAIVNRRDSDITFKVDGVMYTSGGRDIEMSVASTKAFYSQIVAGAILGLYLAGLRDSRNEKFIADEIKQLVSLPDKMRKVLAMQADIEASARSLAVKRTYWAAVGSGPNKAAADEIRIKLSELCYKTVSSDYVEDKKHIDLSAEPLIIVCAAGTRGTVIGDIVKDTAIFHAHKAAPVVIADEGERRFDPYADYVFNVPSLSPHLAVIVNTLVGHIWGYYAALAINEGSRFFFRFRETTQRMVEEQTQNGQGMVELILSKEFREKIAAFYNDFRQRKARHGFPTTCGLETGADLTLLLKYLAGKLPVSDFELDFGIKGSAENMLNTLFNCLNASINEMARPVDAIKHQAKTVTVGTSRIKEQLTGILFDELASHQFETTQLINSNILVLKNLQPVITRIKGATRYRILGLNLLGEPTDVTTIEILAKTGTSADLASRVETDRRLTGTKKIIVRQGNVYIGKGIKDNRSLIVMPIISKSPETPNLIEYLLLLNVAFNADVPLQVKIKALGGKFEHIQNIVQENSIKWDDAYLQQLVMEDLFGLSAEKIGESIVAGLRKTD